jgi:hypothetical protein
MEEQGDHRSWFKRNWKWVVPGGGCVLVIIFIVVLAFGMIGGISNLFEESTPYQLALELANSDSRVTELMGTGIESDGMAKGNITYSNGTQSSILEIPIKGSKSDGVLLLNAYKEGDDWLFRELKVVAVGRTDTISLLPSFPDE